MPSPLSSRARAVLLALAVGLSAPALGQTSPADELAALRAENAALKEQVAKLERELRATKNLVDALRGRGAAPAPAAPTTAPLPDDPMAGPAAMLAQLKKNYAAEMGELADTKDAARHRAAVARWVESQKRSMTGMTSWRVRFDRISTEGEGRRTGTWVTTQIIDAASGLPLGEPFSLEVPARFAQRVRRAKPEELYTLGVRFSADPKFNAQREDVGVFDVPAFIGKYAEFGFTAVWESLEQVPADAPAAPPR